MNDYADNVHSNRLNKTTQNIETVQNFYDIVSGVNGNKINYSKNISEKERLDQRQSFVKALYESISVDKENCFTKLRSIDNEDKLYIDHLKALYSYMFFAYVMHTTPVSCLWTVNDLLNELNKTDQTGRHLYEIYLDRTNLFQKNKIKKFFRSKINNKKIYKNIVNDLINIYKNEFIYAHLKMPDVEHQDILSIANCIKKNDVHYYKMHQIYQCKEFGIYDGDIFIPQCVALPINITSQIYKDRQHGGYIYIPYSDTDEAIENLLAENNQSTIHKIKEISKQGGRVGLFIGRNSEENLPKDYEQDKLNYPEDKDLTWVSASQYDKNLNGGFLESSFSRSSRLHLSMDLTQKGYLDLLSQLFDKVVIDGSTLKFFIQERLNNANKLVVIDALDPVTCFSKLLRPNDQSVFMLPLDHIGDTIAIFRGCKNAIAYGRFEHCIIMNCFNQKFVDESRNIRNDTVIKNIKQHCATLFQNIVHYKNIAYYSCNWPVNQYFKLSGLK